MRLQPIIICASILVASPPVEAADLETALGLMSEGRLVEALTAFEEALGSRGNSTAELVTIYQHLGMLRFAADDGAGAREALMRLRALDRAATVPALAPPEVVSLLEEISAEWGERALSVDVSAPPVEAGAASAEVSVRVLDDLAGMVAGAQVRLGRQVLARSSGAGPFRLTINLGAIDGAEARPVLVLLDEHEGVLLSQGLDLERGGAPVEAPATPTSPSPSRGLDIAGWVLFGVGLVGTGVGAALVAIDSRATGELHPLTRAPEVYDTLVGGWVLVGLGAAVLVTGVALLVAGARRRARARSTLEVAGAGIVARW